MQVTSQTGGSQDRLDLLYHLSQTFNSTLDLDEVLNRVMDEVISALGAERGFIMLEGPGSSLDFRVARGMDHDTIDDPEFQVSKGIVEQVARDGEPLLTSDAQHDSRFSDRQSVMSLRLRSIICVPLAVQGRLIGVVYVDNRLQAGIFSQEDMDLLSAIAINAAIAIENARLYQIAVEKGRMERELQMARQVQNSLLPPAIPVLPGWDFAVSWNPARQVAGDYYDFIPGPAEELDLAIGDVTDKGLPAALFMVFTRSALRASRDHASGAAEGIARTNRLICQESTQGLFVTLFFARLDPATGVVTYVNAGHNPALFYEGDTGLIRHLDKTGMPLGIDEGAAFGEEVIRLNSGDFLLIYTDGITEAVNERNEEFGLDRLEGVVSARPEAGVSDLLAAIEAAVQDFTGGAPPFDDTTMMVVKRVGQG